jgi:eukaryotic-like serine/threonine-protein kinase
VQYAHRNLIVHRDLKPSNILVTSDGTVKLLDFGIAKILDLAERDEPVALTQSRLNWLTPEYASPEQLRGEPVTTASDVYSLGVLLYELLTGVRPYRVKHLMPHEVVRVVCEEEPERPSLRALYSTQLPQVFAEGSAAKLRRRLQGDLDNIVLMALSKEAARRYSMVEQLSEDLRRHLAGEPVSAREPTLLYRTNRYVQRHKVGVSLAALFVVALVVGTLAASLRARAAEAEARQGRRLLYAAQMRQAGYDLVEGNFARLRVTLDSFVPQAGEEDMRGFEWHYLWRQAHREKLVLPHSKIVGCGLRPTAQALQRPYGAHSWGRFCSRRAQFRKLRG